MIATLKPRSGKTYRLTQPVRVVFPPAASGDYLTLHCCSDGVTLDGCPAVKIMRRHESITFISGLPRRFRQPLEVNWETYRQKGSKSKQRLRARKGKRFRWVEEAATWIPV